MSSLYQIDSAIMECFDLETGEIFDSERFEELSIALDKKIENICLFIKNLNAEAEMLKAEEKAFADRRKSAERKAESLRNYIAGYLAGTPFKTTKVAVSFRKSEQVEVIDLLSIPSDYLRFKEPEADKSALKKALKEGKQIDGVALVEKQNIQIK